MSDRPVDVRASGVACGAFRGRWSRAVAPLLLRLLPEGFVGTAVRGVVQKIRSAMRVRAHHWLLRALTRGAAPS